MCDIVRAGACAHASSRSRVGAQAGARTRCARDTGAHAGSGAGPRVGPSARRRES